MSPARDAFLAVLRRRDRNSLPIWEISFDLWDAFGNGRMVLGEEFQRLSPAEQSRAIENDADIIARAAPDLRMSAVSMPGGFWYEAPGKLARFILPGDARYDLARAVRRRVGDRIAIVANTGGVIGADYDADFLREVL